MKRPKGTGSVLELHQMNLFDNTFRFQSHLQHLYRYRTAATTLKCDDGSKVLQLSYLQEETRNGCFSPLRNLRSIKGVLQLF